MARFEQERISDFKDALQAFLNGMISRQKEVSRPVVVTTGQGLIKVDTAHLCLGELSTDTAKTSGRGGGRDITDYVTHNTDFVTA